MANEEMTPELAIAKAIALVKEENLTRSQALTITKLQEAKMWLNEHRQELLAAARKIGFNPGGSPPP